MTSKRLSSLIGGSLCITPLPFHERQQNCPCIKLRAGKEVLGRGWPSGNEAELNFHIFLYDFVLDPFGVEPDNLCAVLINNTNSSKNTTINHD